LEILDVLNVVDEVFAEVKLSQFAAILEVLKRFNLVQAETADLDIRDLLHYRDVFQLAAP